MQLRQLSVMFPLKKVGDLEDGARGDIGRLLDLRGLGEEGSGITTRDELRVAIAVMIWDNDRLRRAVVLKMLRCS